MKLLLGVVVWGGRIMTYIITANVHYDFRN